MAIRVNESVSIPESDLVITASRSGGPGGQNVNKVSSRVTVEFDLRNSAALSPGERARVAAKLTSRISKEGILRVVSQRTRSQDLNRADALERLGELLRDALKVPPRRVKTRVPFGVREGRITDKKRRTEVKRARSSRQWE